MEKRDHRLQNGAPSHKTIQSAIVNDIIRGVFVKGEKIPNQEWFSEKYNVSRTTVRKATDELVRNGILHSVKGVGTFVCDDKENVHQIFLTTDAEEAQKARDGVSSHTIEIAEMACSDATAKQLHIKKGDPILYIERVRLFHGRPYALQTSYLNRNCMENVRLTKEMLDQSSLFHELEIQANLVPKYQDEELRAVACPPRVAKLLDVEPQTPVILAFRTVYAKNGNVMEYCEDYERTDLKGLRIRTYARVRYEMDESGDSQE
jgi:GntR family transcriptional regulator